MDALDHTASPDDQAFFDRHLASCVSCSRMFMDARRGAAWLEMLRDPRPEPPSHLFDRILSQTSGAALHIAPTPLPQPIVLPNPYPALVSVPPNVLPFRPRNAAFSFGQRIIQPRLAMTAAMAFFSIALTLNLAGVRVSELRASDLRPANLRRNLYKANAHVVRYYDNLRVVYELEARVHELQRTAEPELDHNTPAARPEGEPPKPAKKPGPGSSLRQSLPVPLFRESRFVAALIFPETPHPSPKPDTQLKGDRT